MSIIGIWDTKELNEYLDKLKGISEENIQKFHEDTVKEIAARTLAKIITITPTGDYKDQIVKFTAYKGTENEKEVEFLAKASKVGGTLKRGWTAGKDMDAFTFIMANSEVVKKGNTYTIVISNNVFYAPYVEYGFRAVNGRWVDGQFMMTISMDEMQDELPALLEKKFNEFLGEYLK